MTEYVFDTQSFPSAGSPSVIDLVGLEQQVESSGITTELLYITADELTVTFTFVSDLSLVGSPTEVQLLNVVVSEHTGTHVAVPTGDTILSFSFADKDGTPLKTTNPTYTRSATIVFDGTTFFEAEPRKVKVTGYVDGSAVGGVRLYDIDNDVIIGQVSINSNTEQVVEMDTSNWPESQSKIELQIRRTAGGITEYATITSLQILF